MHILRTSTQTLDSEPDTEPDPDPDALMARQSRCRMQDAGYKRKNNA